MAVWKLQKPMPGEAGLEDVIKLNKCVMPGPETDKLLVAAIIFQTLWYLLMTTLWIFWYEMVKLLRHLKLASLLVIQR